jgi:hypothetical protein
MTRPDREVRAAMKMKEWLLAGYEPPIGTIDDWIIDLIGRVRAEEQAMYALRAKHDGRSGVRVLVATDLGLFDFFWDRPEAVKDRALTGTLTPWRDVHGVTLSCETRLNPSTLLRSEPIWRLSIEEPRVTIDDVPAEAVVLDFWRACDEGTRRGSAG